MYTKMPPFWPPHILLRLILGLLPVLSTEEKQKNLSVSMFGKRQLWGPNEKHIGKVHQVILPYLHTGVHVIVDVIVFQHTVAVVIEVNTNLTNVNKHLTIEENIY